MPFYEYQCGDCGHRLEVLQKISDEPLIFCPQCNEASLKKLISAAAFRLKGSGWYETDFKHGDQKKQKSADKKSADAESASSGQSESGSSKPGSSKPGSSDEQAGANRSDKGKSDNGGSDQSAPTSSAQSKENASSAAT